MNDFRSRILSGKASRASSLLREKSPRNNGGGGSLQAVAVPRSQSRSANHRDNDRYRLPDEVLIAKHGRKRHQVRLINLSGGGAMIEGPFSPEMWDRVDLELGQGGTIECAVRWLRGDRIGLEFAHETKISGRAETRISLLREVLDRSFPEASLETARPETQQPAPTEDEPAAEPELKDHSRRSEPRHPLIWCGEVHFDHDTRPVRLRNISASGALIEIMDVLPAGAEVHLDLGEAGALFATVSWTRGDQVGLKFKSRFDLMRLAKTRPQVAPKGWTKPEYLRDENTETSPWASEWGRLTLPELRDTLRR
jgi:hypothetical protein